MITEEREDRRGAQTLFWAFVASVLIHALLVPALFWTWAKNVALAPQAPREWVIASTAVRIERRTVPRPLARPAAPPPQRQVPTQTAAQQPAPPAAARRELAHAAPTAPPQAPERPTARPAPQSLAQQLAQQEQQFAQEVARLNRGDNPLSIAPQSHESPSTYRRTYFDVPGHTAREAVQAILFPLRHWRSGQAICYYVRYVAQFETGSNEQGVIPWPVCYPAGADAIAHPSYPHSVPMPVPQPDYVLPPGTYLTPLLQSIYNARTRPKQS
jgi:hypothetical protein